MKRILTAAIPAALLLTLVSPLEAQRPRDDATEKVAKTIQVRKSGDTLSFDGCVGETCKTEPLDVSTEGEIQLVVWNVEIEGEEVESVEIDFKDGVTPFFDDRGRGQNSGRFQDAAKVRGRRVGRRTEAIGRIKPPRWADNSNGNNVKALDRNRREYKYTIVVTTNVRSYPVDPIVIVRRF